jgi:uncharacterized membrane protein YeaQ/YmgE (transglycosylase-associated protein family)
MELLDVVLLLLIAAACGGLGWASNRSSLIDFLVSAVLGLIGAVLGCWLARVLHLPDLFRIEIDGTSFPLLWAVAGAVFFAVWVQEVFAGGSAGEDG